MLAGTEEKCAQSFPLFESVDGTFYSLAFKLSQLVTEVNKSRFFGVCFKEPFFI